MIPYQVEIGETGLILGPGTQYRVGRTRGLWTRSPEGNDTSKAGEHGSIAGQDRVPSTTLIVETNFGMGLGESNGEEVEDLMEALSGAWKPGPDTFLRLCMRDASVRRRFGRCRGFDGDESQMVRGYAEAVCEFVTTDPRSFSDDLHVSTVGFPAMTEGRTYPLVFPRVYGATGAGGTILAENVGTASVPWTARLNGPLVNPTIEHADQSKTISLVGSIEAGEYVEIDSSLKMVLLNGTASRYDWVTAGSEWFEITPGANTIRLGGSSGTGTLDFYWRDGWW